MSSLLKVGLHASSDPTESPSTPESFERNYVFWSLLSQVCTLSPLACTTTDGYRHHQDKCWSLYVGRDQGIRAPYYDVGDPQTDSNMDAVPWTWTFPSSSGQRVAHSQDSNLSRSFVSQVELMKIAGMIMDEVYSMRSTSKRNGGGINLSRVQDL